MSGRDEQRSDSQSRHGGNEYSSHDSSDHERYRKSQDYNRSDRFGGGYDGGYDGGYGGGYGGGKPLREDKFSPADNNGMQKLEDTIYINNLPQDVTEENLAAHFGSIGIIKTDKKLKKPKIWIYMDKTTNLPKGDATLTYDDPPSADSAIKWFHKKEFMGNIIEVSKAERNMDFLVKGSGRGGGRGGFGGFGGRGGRGGRGGSGGYGRESRGFESGNKEQREGDWTCKSNGCGANNFSRRDECFKCHAPRQDGGNGYSRRSTNNEYHRDRNEDRGGGKDNRRADDRKDRRARPY